MASAVPRRREGGAAAVIYNLGRELERLGHRVEYVFQEDLVEAGKVSARFLELVFSLRLSRHIARNKDKFTVVNLHAPVGFPYGIRRRLRQGAGYPPYVMTLHGLEERRFHVMSREAKKGRAWNFSWKNRMWQRLYHQPRFRWSIRTADGAHTFSRDVWTILQLKYNLDADRVAYIPNGVEQRFFLSRQYERTQPLRLLYVGTWLDQRGIFYLREALPRVFRERPGMRFTFAGPGALAEEIQRFFGSQISERLDILPTVPWERMPQLYAEHDILVFPSLLEGQPSVVLEAMASGMPVITAETCGMVDAIEHGFDGWLVPPGDSEAIAEAILHLSDGSNLRRELGEQAQRRMKRQTWERAGQQFEKLLQKVVHENDAGAER